MIQINLYIGSRYPVNRGKLRSFARDFLLTHHINNAQVDISVVGVRKITALNEKQLGYAEKTDVLSFPLHPKQKLDDFPLPSGIPPHLGDVVISFPEAISQAKKLGRLVDDQLCYYLEHGLLHLLGYHHE